MIGNRPLLSYLSAVVLACLSLPLAAQMNLGSVDVGSNSTVTVTVTVLSAAKLGAISVRTQGAENLDFTNAGGGTCAVGATYAANATCTVDVTFTPAYPGPRYGAVVLLDSTSSRTPIATSYLQGTGQGAQIVYPWGTPENLGPVKIYPQTEFDSNASNGGLAIDGNGDIYVASAEYDTNNPHNTSNFGVTKRTLSNGSYTASTVSATGGPGIAVDGGGNLFYGCGTTVCKAVPKPDGTYTISTIASGFSVVFGVAVDGGGNVYVVDNTAGTLFKETLQADGAYLQSEIASGLNEPYGPLGFDGPAQASGVAVDGSGNLYVADGAYKVYKESPSGGAYTQSTVSSSAPGNVSVAADRIGNVYVADQSYFYYQGSGCSAAAIGFIPGAAMIEEVLQPDDSYLPQSIGNPTSPNVVAVDASGNLYLVDTGIIYNQCLSYGQLFLYKPNYTNPPSFNFGSVNYGSTGGPQVVSLSNSGNLPLTFSAIAFPNGFVEDSAATGDCKVGTPLAAGESCTISIDFRPTAPLSGGTPVPFSGDVTLTSNSLIGSQQSIAVSGTETALMVAPPVFSPAAGNYSNALTVTITDSTPGTRIYYTLNGTTPTTSSTKYTGPVAIKNSYMLRAIAVSPTPYSVNGSASGAYDLIAATPVATPAGGVYSTAQTVTLATASTTAHIYYTTNGATPTGMSKLYTGPITVGASETVKAIAVATGYASGPVATEAYIIVTPAATPTFSPAAGTYDNTQTVTILDSTPGAIIHYTLNGTTPTTSSTKYTGPIAIKSPHALQAIAEASPDYSVSAVGSATYNFAAAIPVVSLASGTYTGAQTVTIATASTSASIHYTTNGSTPSSNTPKYTGPITVSASETLKAIAIATGYTSSAVVAEVYTIH